MNASILDSLKTMIKSLENSLIDAEKLVLKGNARAGLRIRKNMQNIRKHAFDVRQLVQEVKEEKLRLKR